MVIVDNHSSNLSFFSPAHRLVRYFEQGPAATNERNHLFVRSCGFSPLPLHLSQLPTLTFGILFHKHTHTHTKKTIYKFVPSLEQFARVKKPFDFPVNSKVSIAQRPLSHGALMIKVRNQEVRRRMQNRVNAFGLL